MTMPTEPRGGGAPDIEGWLDRLATTLGPELLAELGLEERVALLDLARIAAHRSHRSAAPITTYLVGLSLASSSRADRLTRLHELARRLDTD